MSEPQVSRDAEPDTTQGARASASNAAGDGTATVSARHGLVRHGGGFLVSGLLAFSVDALILWGLTRGAELDPFSARLIALVFAMVVAWLSHRRLTFNVSTPPTLAEFGRYAAVAWTAATVNYLVYSAILIVRSEVAPLVAMVAATIVSMCFSYLGMRFGVFRHRGPA